MSTRTWLTTPEGTAPLDDSASDERWVRGPTVPVEPRVPTRYRGAIGMLVAAVLTVALTFLVAPSLLGERQDPSLGGDPDSVTPSEGGLPGENVSG